MIHNDTQGSVYDNVKLKNVPILIDLQEQESQKDHTQQVTLPIE